VLAFGGSDCEAADGWFGQPVNGLTSLAYIAAAVYVLRRDGPLVSTAALAAVGVGSVLYHGPMLAGAGLIHDGSIAALVLACLVGVVRGTIGRPPPVAMVTMAAAVAVNVLTRTGAPLCRPDSLLQGHGAWHVLTAVALAAWLGSPRRAWRRSAEPASADEPTSRSIAQPEPAPRV
jgi:hypothetical protein